jgi:hypothetical protein
MGRIGLAFRAFLGVLSGSVPIERMQALLSGVEFAPPEAIPAAPPAPAPGPAAPPATKPSRSEAITLLATLQREARFVDLVQEPLDQYRDEQVGAAARDVLRDCRQVMDRMFALQPVMEGEENAEVETGAQVHPGRLRISGNASGEPPFRGRLVHHGWEATRCELPRWSGDDRAVRVIAPAEIEC